MLARCCLFFHFDAVFRFFDSDMMMLPTSLVLPDSLLDAAMMPSALPHAISLCCLFFFFSSFHASYAVRCFDIISPFPRCFAFDAS